MSKLYSLGFKDFFFISDIWECIGGLIERRMSVN